MQRTLTLLLATLLTALHAGAVLTVQLVVGHEQCSNNNGSIATMVNGGEAPYTFLWSNGSTAESITNLDAGDYSVTVIDGLGTEVTENATVLDVPYLHVPDIYYNGQSYIYVSNADMYACGSMCNGGFGWTSGFLPGAVQPVVYSPAPFQSDAWGATFMGYCYGETPQITITDATGCSGTFTVNPIPGLLAPPMEVSTVPACGPTGSITVQLVPLIDMCYCEVWLLDANDEVVDSVLWQTGPLVTFNNVPPGSYTVIRPTLTGSSCPDSIAAVVEDLGPDCGVVSGNLFLDHDQDCVQDANDEPLPYRVLTITPGPEYAISSSNGTYERGLLYGNYSIVQPLADVQQLCPGTSPTSFSLSSGTSTAAVDFADSSLVPLDISAALSSTFARPGFFFTYYGHIANNSGQLTGPIDATLTYDPALIANVISPTPTTAGANSITWNDLPGLGAYGGMSFIVQFMVPVGTPLGTVLDASFTASCTFAENDLSDNTAVHSTTVIGSYDPNEKVARTSSGQSDADYYIGTDEWIDYTIHFQNTGTDTAFTVVITDTLAAELDMSTYEQGMASHPFEVAFRSGRVVEWTFEGINLMDSTSAEPESHGLVRFRIKPMQPLLPGTVISNAADIFFDFNDPVRTADEVLIAALSTDVASPHGAPTLRVYPQPATDRVRVSGVALGSTYRLLHTDGPLIAAGRIDAEGVDLSALARGTYLLSVLDATAGWQHARVVKE